MNPTPAPFRQQKTDLLAQCAQLQSLKLAHRVHGHLQRLSDLCDAHLQALWHQAAMPAEACLVAVGGFGRGALFPYSDIDVLVLLPPHVSVDHDAALKSKVEHFIGSCWDAGLEIGSSVRNLTECLSEAAKDITVQTAMLESRPVVGDEALFVQFSEAFKAQMEARAFFTGKTLEMQQRHSKFENTPYALEPNCKESPGGLRDLHMLLWVAKASGLGATWKDLAQAGMITALELGQLKRNEDVLSLIRWRLHWLAKRREDRLVFDLQTAVAQDLGLSASKDGSPIRAKTVKP